MHDRELRLKEIAFLIWEEEGCPPGQAERHWRMAESALRQEEAERTQRKIDEGEPPGETSVEDVSELRDFRHPLGDDRLGAPDRGD